VAALSVAKAIEKVTGTVSTPALQIKWPNDVVIDKKKVCGILTEMNLKGSEIDFVIVGIGINVHQKQFSKEILDVATSLDLITGEKNSREELTEALLEAFEICYKQYIKTGNLEYLKQEYEHYLANKDSQVKVLDPAGSYEGIAKGITNKGELIVDTGHEICYVSSGEVSVRGIYGYV
jgi:BirA family biotin operon repressor/biotin-[acetyl-CoA-carboxylase] ligase